MIQSLQIAFQISCSCGGNRYDGLTNYHLDAKEHDRLKSFVDTFCPCKGTAWTVDWHVQWASDPIATVRTRHPRAFALPPGALCGQWSVVPHANTSPLPDHLATGATEADAWAAAAALVLEQP